MSQEEKEAGVDDELAREAAELDGYFSDTPLSPEPNYPPLKTSMDTAVIILNLPKVPQAKEEKLTKVVLKLVSKIGTLASHAETDFKGFYMPSTAGKTLGYACVEYQTVADATNAAQVLNGYKFDKHHTLAVMPLDNVQELQDFDESKEFELPNPPPFVQPPDPTAWLADSNQRDQFVIRHGRETIVYWFDVKSHIPFCVDYDGRREKEAGVAWCEYYCHWSPKGTYLATLVPNRGVILWTGQDYTKFRRFSAPRVEYILFSPQERYLLTSTNLPKDEHAIKIFNVATGDLLRTFSLYPSGYLKDVDTSAAAPPPPPPFQWSHDDKYLARMGKDLISIFETPSMKLLDKRSLSADGIHEFQWSPKANILAYWAPEHKNSPAHVDLIQIPSRKKLRQKNLFHVSKCSMVWQSDGEYLGVKVTRHTKSKKTLYNNLELFRLNELSPTNSSIPVEMLDIQDAVMAFSFEPGSGSSRFCVVHADNPSAAKVKVSFYDMKKKVTSSSSKKKKGSTTSIVAELHKVETLENKQCNCIFWSPAGSTILLASLGESSSGTLEFYNVDTKTLVVKEHYRCNQIAWDPSGRTVASIVSQPIGGGGHFKFAMDNGCIVWSFQGKQLYQQSYETFYQFSWRPRERLLDRTEVERVRRNLKQYEAQFDQQDKERQRALKLEETKGKRAQRTKYRNLVSRLRAIRRRQKQDRMVLYGGYDSDDEENYVDRRITMETILSSKEEVVM